MSAGILAALVKDVHELALGMPHVTLGHGPRGNPVYQVGENPSSSSARLGLTPTTRRPASASRT